MHLTRYRLILLLSLLLGLAFQASAQQATIVGTVTDPSGSVVPGAAITITNTETGQSLTVTSNEAGQYIAPSLNIGTYTVKAELKSFKTFVSSGVVLRIGDRSRVDVKLEVGTTAETVTVESEAIRVQVDSSDISDVVTGTQLSNLMSNGRHFANLMALVPGASSNMNSFNFPQAGNVDISFNGQSPAHNVWITDGGENYDRGGWGTNYMPSMDAVAEFRTLTSNYSAEYGLASGATMTMVFKSGTRNLHGALWENLRNDNFDANDWFRNKAKNPKAPFNLNIFGFNAGGPIPVGKLREKTFFFYNMEWRKLRQSGTTTQNVASQAWRDGNLGSLLARSNPVQIKVPAANTLSAAQVARFAAYGLNPGDPFPNNVIPSGLIDANAKAFLGTGVMPLPNTSTGGVDKWTGGTSSPNNVREELIRVDHRFTDKFSVFGHYLAENMARIDAPPTWSGSSYPTVSSAFNNPSYSYVIHTTYTITPTVLNEAAYNASGNKIDILSNGNYQRPSGFNVPEVFAGNNDNRLPRIAWQKELGTSYDTWAQPWHNKADLWQFRDDLSWTRGRHGFKVGASIMGYKKKQDLNARTQGNFTFDGNYTGSSFADFLLGYAANYQELALQDYGQWKNRNYSVYFQDNWRVNNRLTLNLGLRWEGMPAVIEESNRMSNFYPDLYDRSKAPRFASNDVTKNQLDPTGPGFQVVSGVPLSTIPFYMNGIGIAGQGNIPQGLVNNSWNNFGPRIGFAYDLTNNGKTVLRAGFGRMYERVQGNDVYNGGGNAPFSFQPTVSNVMLSNPNIAVNTGTAASAPIFPAGITGKVLDNYKSPTSNQWSAGLQQELFPRGVISVAYVGNVNVHQSSQRDINSPMLSQTADRQAVVNKTINIDRIRPYPGWGTIVLAENAGVSNYHSLQTNMRISGFHGLDMQLAYTLSRAFNDVRNAGSGGDLGTIDNPYDRSYNRGLAPWDRTHVVSINYNYMLPFFRNSSNKAVKILLGGWQLNGITSFISGAATTLTYDNSRLGMSNTTNRPNLNGSVNVTKQYLADGVQWMTKDGLSAPADLMFGTAPKDVVRGPGRNNFDLSLFKNFAGIPFINSEGANMQFRLESFNAFNHPQWAGFQTNFSASDFGNVTGTRGPRQLQLGLKFVF